MANHHHQQHEKKKMDHFSHKHPLSLIEDEEEMSKSDEYKNNRSFLRCYGCTEKIRSGVPYYRCEEHCPSFCLHLSCAHLPTTIRRVHSLKGCDDRDLQLMKRPNKDYEFCTVCFGNWYRFSYVCSVCPRWIDVRCAFLKGPNEAKHSFHQHPVQPFFYRGKVDDDDSQQLVCSVCSLIITPFRGDVYVYYRCNYCKFNVHPQCTNVPLEFESPSHPHQHILHLAFNYRGSKICKICQEEIHRNTQWAYFCGDCAREDDEYYIHAGYEGCLMRKADLQHFDHEHPLALVKEKAPPTLGSTDDRSIAQDCRCCRQKISFMPYYTCINCKSYHMHKQCALLSREIQHPLHPKCTLNLLSGLRVICDVCGQKINGFAYHCSPCNFNLDIECALKTQRVKTIFHKQHPLFLSPTKGPYNCHACDRDNEGSSYQCTSCKFWLHDNCASLPVVKDNTSHEHPHELHLVHDIPEKFYGVVVYCRICMKALKRHRWAYHCNLCRYFTHVHDCSNHVRKGDGVTIDPSDVVHLPLDGEPILEEKLTDGKITKHHRHPMILFADQLESNVVAINTAFTNLIRGSETWPIFRVNGKDYSGITFSFNNNTLNMQVTGVPRYIKHEDHHHFLESTFLNSSTWCHACEQSFFGCGFKCTTCAFTIDTYCALLPRIIKHRYDKHDFFLLTYSAIKGVEEYVCEICEEDVLPRYFYHCVDCDQSIHARCIWKAYVQFQPYYKLDLGRRSVLLVPPSEKLPECIMCKKKETDGHGFAFRDYNDRKYMVHLRCIYEDDLET